MRYFPPYYKGPIKFPIVGPIVSTIVGGVYSDIVNRIKACDPLVARDSRLIDSANTGRPILQGAAMSFDGATQHAVYTQSSDLSSTDWNYSFWVKLNSTANAPLLSQRNGTGVGRSLIEIKNGVLVTLLGNGSSVPSTLAVSTNWCNVAISKVGNVFTMTLDGVSEILGISAMESATGDIQLAVNKPRSLRAAASFLDFRVTGTANQRWDLRDNGLSALTSGTDLTLVGSPVSVTDNTIPVDTANERGFTDDNGTIYLALSDDPSTDVLGNPTQWQGSAYPVRPVERQSNALEFDGATQYGYYDAGNTDDDGFGAVTISGRFKRASTTGVTRVLWSKGSSAYRLYHGATNILTLNSLTSTGYALPFDSWVTIEVDYNVSGEATEMRVEGVTEWTGVAPVGSTAGSSNFSFGARDSSGFGLFYIGVASSLEITGDTSIRFPLAEGTGSTAYNTDGTNHATLVGNPTWVREDGIPSSNLDDGFSLYEHASLDPLRVPYGDDGQPITITPPTGYTKISDNPAVSDSHNDAETVLDYYNIATDGGTTPAVLASGVAITDYTFGDSVTNPLFRRTISSVLEDRHTLFAAVLTGECLETANEYTDQ